MCFFTKKIKISKCTRYIRIFLFSLSFILFSNISYSQKEENIWYFGNRAGLDFNSGSPVALTDGVLFTNEGCSVISDNTGNLLFYTDGTRVWNKNHRQMPNGLELMGNFSSNQSAVTVSHLINLN